jgi:DNA-binding transcriptional LysR family regulator
LVYTRNPLGWAAVLTLAQLEAFAKAAELGHFSRAAVALHLTQPTISFHIRSLERELGVALFEIDGRRVRLTQAGRLLRERVTPILNEVHATRDALRDYAALRSGHLTVGATRTIGGYVLPDLLAGFHRLRPDIALEAVVDNTAQIEARLLARELDLALVEGEVTSPELSVEPFREDELVVLLAPEHRLAERQRLSPADLPGEALVEREPGSGTRALAERVLGPVLEQTRRVLVLDNPEAINRAVEGGLGIAIQSATIATRDVAAGRLRALRIDGHPMVRSFALVRLSARPMSPAASEFREQVLSRNGR